jgi:hypothetical protein
MFGDAAMTLAAAGRLVDHSTIFQMNVESYRRKAAVARAPLKPKTPIDSKRDTGAQRHKALPASATPAEVPPVGNPPLSPRST